MLVEPNQVLCKPGVRNALPLPPAVSLAFSGVERLRWPEALGEVRALPSRGFPSLLPIWSLNPPLGVRQSAPVHGQETKLTHDRDGIARGQDMHMQLVGVEDGIVLTVEVDDAPATGPANP